MDWVFYLSGDRRYSKSKKYVVIQVIITAIKKKSKQDIIKTNREPALIRSDIEAGLKK